MAGEKIFLSIVIILILFNAIFYLSGINTGIISSSTLIGTLTSVGVIGILISIIPTTSPSEMVKYLLSGVIMIALLYSFTLPILTYNIPVGVGLLSNIVSMFSSDPSQLSFMPYIFFQVLGLIGLVSGIASISATGG